MYRTCMFCTKSLGENEVLEVFPVGRRLAFDAERGRLWVVCRHCERWNLTPMEERWEAVEACERIFSDTRLRVSTDNIGLARHREGLELVRIGRPQRNEFAAWRYGDQFGRRRKKALIIGGVAVAAFAGVTFAGAAVVGGSSMGGYWMWQVFEGIRNGRTQARLRLDDGGVIKLNGQDLKQVRVRPAESAADGFRLVVEKKKREWVFEGPRAAQYAGQIVPAINKAGGRQRTVEDAVTEIERHGHPDRFLADLTRGDRFYSKKGVPGYINKMPAPTKLALEMAIHEEEERRALEGELWRLERAWEEAEEIAAISDNLLLPEGADDFLEQHREG
ncbi:hypothetical protein [Gaopeijia maritima]|uniref:Uncharacterized protein n=2 Tax=Gaopeijia maritima TaxID=3119007 RepID=A0ABU9E700_9BACT